MRVHACFLWLVRMRASSHVGHTFFSESYLRSSCRTCEQLSAQDADGWRGSEHVGWLFADGDSTLQGLLRTHLILPHILGDFLADHLDEIAGGRMFALEKANNSLRPIVIGSLWRRCAARLGVAEVRSNVATFFMSQYTNFIQFGGESIWGPLDAHKSLSF